MHKSQLNDKKDSKINGSFRNYVDFLGTVQLR